MQDGRASKEADEYISALNSARDSVVAVLHADSGIDTHGDVDSVLQKYMALLLGLVNKGPAKETPPDIQVVETKLGADSKLRSSISFTWQVRKGPYEPQRGCMEPLHELWGGGAKRERRC